MAKNFMTAMMNTKASTPPPMYSATEKIKKEITILESIRKFIPPLSAEEKQQLEQNILEFGCKDPLTIWETSHGLIDANTEQPDEIAYVLIDGHNRYEICKKFGVDFKISVVEFENFDQIHDFMIDHQLGRRNLSSEQMSYLRGLKYKALKKNDVQRDKSGKFFSENPPSGQNDQAVNLTENRTERSGVDLGKNAGQSPSGQNDQTVNLAENRTERSGVDLGKNAGQSPSGQNDQTVNLTENRTERSGVDLGKNAGQSPSGQNDQTVKRTSLSEQLAEQFNVGEKTIRRDADFAKGLDLLPIELRNEVLQGKSYLNKADIIEIGKSKDAENVGEVVKEFLSKAAKSGNTLKGKIASTDRKKEKIINLAKSMSSIDDCDKLIRLVNEYKSTI